MGPGEHARRAPFQLPRALDALGGSMWGPVELVEETGSTNTDLRERALDGAPHGFVLVSDFQSTGKGRLARHWVAPSGSGLLFSVLLRPDSAVPRRWGWLPLASALAVNGALGEFVAGTGIKWPNDILCEEAKVAGVLCERVETPSGGAAIVGIGINVDQRRDELPTDTATSLRLLDVEVNREPLLVAVLTHLVTRYAQWEAGEWTRLHTDYVAASVTLGRRVRVELPSGGAAVGRASGPDDAGRLIVTTEQGPTALAAGDVTHLRHHE